MKIFIFPRAQREALNKQLAKIGVMPFGKDDRSRTSIYGTFYLTDHLPEDIGTDGLTFDYDEDWAKNLFWPKEVIL